MDAVYWHEGMKWVIDRIYIMQPIRFTNIRRNELSSKVSHKSVFNAANAGKLPKPIYASNDIQQRASMILKDVRYVIETHFVLTDKLHEGDSEEKFYNIALRRLRNGQNYAQPYLGAREFPAKVRLLDKGEEIEPIDINADLGLIHFDMDYSKNDRQTPMYFRAEISHGVLDLRGVEVLK